jgi:hypothetical protein
MDSDTYRRLYWYPQLCPTCTAKGLSIEAKRSLAFSWTRGDGGVAAEEEEKA